MNKPTKTCEGCRFVLDFDAFGSGVTPSPYCDVCRDERREAQPWTDHEVAVLAAAAKRALDLWPRHLDHLSDDDLDRLRDLVNAAGREHDAAGGAGMQQRLAPIVDRFFVIREKWARRKAA